MKTFKPRSMAEYVDVIEQLQADAEGPLWYRGCSDTSYSLLPSLYRKRAQDTRPKNLSELEQGLVTRFRERSIPYQTRPIGQNTLETLFLMQHFGVPTRLLDWTENPLSGLFFAVRDAPYRRGAEGKVIFRQQAVVWVLDPVRWNRAALSQTSFAGGVLNPDHEAIQAYRAVGRIEELAPRPIALYGAHNSPRIVAQQGVFVLFGRDARAMEVVARQEGFDSRCLKRVVITRGVIGPVRDSLWRHGITHATLFPDLEGLARDLRRTYGFDI